MSKIVRSQMVPKGVLRAGINMSNPLLVSGVSETGDPVGVAPDIARIIAENFDVPVVYVKFPKPGLLADAAGRDIWDICLIGAEPLRAQKIDFTSAYSEIEATYLVPAESLAKTIDDIDHPGIRICVEGRAAFELWLSRNIKHAELILCDSFDLTLERFVDEKFDALADLRPRLHETITKLPGTRILDGKFTSVQQSIGVTRGNTESLEYLEDFVKQAKAAGIIEGFIKKHHVHGLSVAE